MMAKWREMALEMRRTAVNLIELHAHRCNGDDCNQFATWERVGRGFSDYACDRCVIDFKTEDALVDEKEYSGRPKWSRREDADAIMEMTKASINIGINAR